MCLARGRNAACHRNRKCRGKLGTSVPYFLRPRLAILPTAMSWFRLERNRQMADPQQHGPMLVAANQPRRRPVELGIARDNRDELNDGSSRGSRRIVVSGVRLFGGKVRPRTGRAGGLGVATKSSQSFASAGQADVFGVKNLMRPACAGLRLAGNPVSSLVCFGIVCAAGIGHWRGAASPIGHDPSEASHAYDHAGGVRLSAARLWSATGKNLITMRFAISAHAGRPNVRTQRGILPWHGSADKVPLTRATPWHVWR